MAQEKNLKDWKPYDAQHSHFQSRWVYTYLGYLGSQSQTESLGQLCRQILIAIALLATVFYLPRLIRRISGNAP